MCVSFIVMWGGGERLCGCRGGQAGRQTGTDECNGMRFMRVQFRVTCSPSSIDELKKKEGEKEDKGGEERRSPHSQFRPRIVLTP